MSPVGGKRPGAGRPRVEVKKIIPMRSMRIEDTDWAIIKAKAQAAGLNTTQYIIKASLTARMEDIR